MLFMNRKQLMLVYTYHLVYQGLNSGFNTGLNTVNALTRALTHRINQRKPANMFISDIGGSAGLILGMSQTV